MTSKAPNRFAIGIERLLDILVSGGSLLVFSPLFLVISSALWIESGFPIIFSQTRLGNNGRPFQMHKFRKFASDCGTDGCAVSIKGDQRLTAVGALLEKSKLNELPQLWNILKGDMSIVGPRPHALAHDSQYGEQIATYADRFRAKPGLTGLAQVNGLRGEIQDLRCMRERIAADNLYIESWSLGLDIAILAKTALIIFSDPQAY